jgi:hypothetical protein
MPMVNFFQGGKTMKRLNIVFAFLLVFSIALAPSITNAQDAYVIVNSDNPVSSLTTSELIKIFKGTKKTWDNGAKIAPVVQKAEVEGFFDMIDMSKKKYDKYWIKLSLSGKAAPLKSFSSDAAVVSYVQGNENGIGYVSSKDNLAGVKTVDIVE